MKKYSKEFKSEAIKLSDELGVKTACAQLGIAYYTLADWRKDRKEEQNRIPLSDAEKRNKEL